MGFLRVLLRRFDADTGRTLYYESADAAQQHLEEAGDALGDAVCDAIAEYGCRAHPECCGAVRPFWSCQPFSTMS